MTKQSKIQKLKEYFEKCDNVVFAFLFGSQAEKRTTPSTYKELLKTLGSVLPFSPKITEKLAHWAELRNIIAHEYLDIKWKRIQDFLQHSKSCFNSFLKSSKQFLETSRSE